MSDSADLGVDSEDRALLAGRDYSIWPTMKLARARQLASSLQTSMMLWRLSLGMETRVEFSADRTEATFYANIPTPAPVHEWSLLYGDIVHNYRSALDALVWAMAHLDGRSPSPQAARRLAFPFAQSEREWERLIQNELAILPALVLYRLDHVQPYHGPDADKGIGVFLHALDIEDKHREALRVNLAAQGDAPFAVEYRFMDDVSDPDSDLGRMDWAIKDGAVKDGDLVGKITESQPIADALIEQLPLTVQVELAGTPYDALEMLRLIDHQVAMSFVVVERGPGSDDYQTMAEGFTSDRNGEGNEFAAPSA